MDISLEKEIKSNFEAVKDQITKGCKLFNRLDNPPTLLAVSKNQSIEKIRTMHTLGQKVFAESYASQLIEKTTALKDLSISWSFIGQLQSNKIKKIVQHADEIQSISSEKHARFIANHAKDLNKIPYPVFISINAGKESSKGGVSMDEAESLAKTITEKYPELHLRGIMTIPPFEYKDSEDKDNKDIPELYRRIKDLSLKIGDGILSLGMSGDLKIAIGAGSHILRIGTALFGKRD